MTDELLCSALLRRTGMSVRRLDTTEGTSRTLTTLPSMNPNWRRASMASSRPRQALSSASASISRRPPSASIHAIAAAGRSVNSADVSGRRQHRQRQRVSVGAAVRELHVCHREKRRERRLQRTAVEHADTRNRSGLAAEPALAREKSRQRRRFEHRTGGTLEHAFEARSPEQRDSRHQPPVPERTVGRCRM